MSLDDERFGIFSGDPATMVTWIASIEGLAKAKLRMAEIARQKPGRYFIWDWGNRALVAEMDTTELALTQRMVPRASRG